MLPFLGQLPPASLELLGFLFWLLKDLGWCLLWAPLCFPAAAASIIVEVFLLIRSWRTSPDVVWWHDAAATLWLLGNATWMLVELLFDPKDQPNASTFFRWSFAAAPLAGPSESRYRLGLGWAQRLLGLALLAAAIACYAAAKFFWGNSRPSADIDDEAAGSATTDSCRIHPCARKRLPNEVYDRCFFGPWILKDLMWSLDRLLPGLFLSGIVLVLVILGNFWRVGEEEEGPQILLGAKLLWVLGNAVWMFGELGLENRTAAPRLVAAGSLATAVLLVGQNMMIAAQRCCQRRPTPLSGKSSIEKEGRKERRPDSSDSKAGRPEGEEEERVPLLAAAPRASSSG